MKKNKTIKRELELKIILESKKRVRFESKKRVFDNEYM